LNSLANIDSPPSIDLAELRRPSRVDVVSMDTDGEWLTMAPGSARIVSPARRSATRWAYDGRWVSSKSMGNTGRALVRPTVFLTVC